MAKDLGTIWVCQCCMLCHANGECCDVKHDREPWGKVTAMPGFSVTQGLLESEHSEHCTPADREEGCDCDRITFSTSACEGCGDTDHGERYAVTLWDDVVSV